MLTLEDAEAEFVGHDKHCELSSFAYLPAAHAVHVSAVALTTSENLPGAQRVHVADPDCTLYLPATQATHTPSVPDHPALQEHCAMLLLMYAESEFCGHF